MCQRLRDNKKKKKWSLCPFIPDKKSLWYGYVQLSVYLEEVIDHVPCMIHKNKICTVTYRMVYECQKVSTRYFLSM